MTERAQLNYDLAFKKTHRSHLKLFLPRRRLKNLVYNYCGSVKISVPLGPALLCQATGPRLVKYRVLEGLGRADAQC